MWPWGVHGRCEGRGGTQGGYVLSKKPNEIKLTNIFHAVDEKVKTVQCKKESKKGCNGKATKCVTQIFGMN